VRAVRGEAGEPLDERRQVASIEERADIEDAVARPVGERRRARPSMDVERHRLDAGGRHAETFDDLPL
jgi:hypothetical protein